MSGKQLTFTSKLPGYFNKLVGGIVREDGPTSLSNIPPKAARTRLPSAD
jgi:hypothetical protein